MADTIVQQLIAQTETAALAEIDLHCKETDRLLAEMKQRQANIDRLRQDSLERFTRIDAAVEKLSAIK